MDENRITVDGRRYVAVDADGCCLGCAFDNRPVHDCLPCLPEERCDRRSVIGRRSPMDENRVTMDGKEYVAVETWPDAHCRNCAFLLGDTVDCPPCMGFERHDGRNVIWKEVKNGNTGN